MDFLEELQNLNLELKPEELKEITAKYILLKEERRKLDKEMAEKGFGGFNHMSSTRGDILRFVFRLAENDNIANIITQVHKTFSNKGTLHKIIGDLYSIGYGTRDICYVLYKMGFRQFNPDAVSGHISYNRWEYDRRRQKFMQMIKDVKSSVFQEIAKEVKETELATANIYIKCIKKLQDHIETLDVVLQPTEFRRVTNQIEELQRRINSMHGIDSMRIASVDVTAKLALAKGLREIEKGDSETGKKLEEGTMIEATEIDSPFSLPASVQD